MSIFLLALPNPSPTPVGVPGAGIFAQPFLLSLLVWAPVVVAVFVAVMPNPRGRYDGLMKQIAFFTNLLMGFLVFIAYNQFQSYLPTAQFEEKQPWLPAIGVTYHLGVDGVGMVMLVLSTLVGIASVLASLSVRERVRGYFALLLLTQGAVNGAIVARDMFVLILFWAAVAIPIAILVMGWGGPRRASGTWRLIGYWGFGTVALIVGTMALYSFTGGKSFDMDTLLKTTINPRMQLVVGLLMLIAGMTRLPIFPLHGWIRDLTAEAPVGVAVIVMGATTRLGAYLILRTLISAEPVAAHLMSPLLAALAALTVGYAALAALRALDVRHVAAYLAMIPGGITLLGFAAVSPLSIAGSVLSLFAGGLAAALIVGVCAILAERAQTRSLLVLGGLAPRMPNVAWLLTIAALGLLGVPILGTFTAELMTFFGAFKNQPIGAFAVAVGLVLAAVALGKLLYRVLFGAANPDAPGVSDASLGESWFLGLLAGALLWVGLFPGGPKIPGTDVPLFDPGLVNQMASGLSEIASPYAAPSVPAVPGAAQ